MDTYLTFPWTPVPDYAFTHLISVSSYPAASSGHQEEQEPQLPEDLQAPTYATNDVYPSIDPSDLLTQSGADATEIFNDWAYLRWSEESSSTVYYSPDVRLSRF